MVGWTLSMDLVAQATSQSGLFQVIVQYAALALVISGVAIAAIVTWKLMRAKPLATIPHEDFSESSMPLPEARFAQSSSPINEPARPAGSSSPDLAEAQRLFSLMGEAEDLASRLGADLDRKADQLTRLIEQADTRIARLEQLRSDLRIDNPAPTSSTEQISAPRPVVTIPRRPQPIATSPSAATPSHSPTGHGMFGTSPAPVPVPTEEASPLDPMTAEVYRLADAGQQPRDIAKRLGQHIGKVELILALRH